MGDVASIPQRVGDLGAYLREQRENAKLSVRQLASLTGVSNPYLSQVERGLRRPSAEVLQQIAKGLRISAEALYVRAGILDESARGTLEAAIDADEGLTSRQKKVLRELCAHFRSENAREGVPTAPTAPEVELDAVPAEELIDELVADVSDETDVFDETGETDDIGETRETGEARAVARDGDLPPTPTTDTASDAR
jgi:transcriptional regulator with XRE-family HTH domain